MALTVGSLFSGIGGFDLGLERAGMQVVWVVESDAFCQFVLAKQFPSATRYADVRILSASQVRPVDVLVGGFPCQDISMAGNSYKGEGISGKKSGLWSEFFRLIRELRPRYVVIENSSALAAKGLDRVLCDLASCGYDAEWDRVSARAFGAPHIRERLIVVAYPNGDGLQRNSYGRSRVLSTERWARRRNQPLRGSWWDTEREPPRVDDGVSNRMDTDTRYRFQATGNALIPQIAEWIGNCIVEADSEV